MWELGTLALCMVENLCITDSWPSVFMVPLHREFIQPCRTVIFNMEKPMCKWTHAIQTSIVKGPTLLLFLPSCPLGVILLCFTTVCVCVCVCVCVYIYKLNSAFLLTLPCLRSHLYAKNMGK